MKIELTAVEARILGALIEKERATPEQYPLSLNAIVNACNQKSSREPVMNLEEAAVAQAMHGLEQRGFLWRKSEAGGRVPKFGHRLDNLLSEPTPQEAGVLCALLLRGPQTPGELRGRTGRLCELAGVAETETVLDGLVRRPGGPFVAKLPREAGRKESRYVELFSASAPAPAPSAPAADGGERLARLEARFARLEAAVEELRTRLDGKAA